MTSTTKQALTDIASLVDAMRQVDMALALAQRKAADVSAAPLEGIDDAVNHVIRQLNVTTPTPQKESELHRRNDAVRMAITAAKTAAQQSSAAAQFDEVNAEIERVQTAAGEARKEIDRRANAAGWKKRTVSDRFLHNPRTPQDHAHLNRINNAALAAARDGAQWVNPLADQRAALAQQVVVLGQDLRAAINPLPGGDINPNPFAFLDVLSRAEPLRNQHAAIQELFDQAETYYEGERDERAAAAERRQLDPIVDLVNTTVKSVKAQRATYQSKIANARDQYERALQTLRSVAGSDAAARQVVGKV